MSAAHERNEATGPLLQVNDLSVDFAVDGFWVPAAKKLNYEVEGGKALAIVGESGSGKSASSMAILDLLPSNARIRGSVKLAGRELRGLRPDEMRKVRGADIAVIFQEPMTALNPVYTVGFQIIETLRIHFGITPSAARERALELLEMVEL
ncbi:MAG: ATP-binding cassette domain-containing protein, partial [Microthrixaceae bacterium]|nr:ATP-binding cassette domain-containing protein [Microthrixaceae bacterium]